MCFILLCCIDPIIILRRPVFFGVFSLASCIFCGCIVMLCVEYVFEMACRLFDCGSRLCNRLRYRTVVVGYDYMCRFFVQCAVRFRILFPSLLGRILRARFLWSLHREMRLYRVVQMLALELSYAWGGVVRAAPGAVITEERCALEPAVTDGALDTDNFRRRERLSP